MPHNGHVFSRGVYLNDSDQGPSSYCLNLFLLGTSPEDGAFTGITFQLYGSQKQKPSTATSISREGVAKLLPKPPTKQQVSFYWTLLTDTPAST